MDEKVSGSTLRKIGASLARFADVRGTAKEPRDRVVVQANGSTLKVVAGSEAGTLIATVHATTQTFKAVVPARDFLLACKQAEAKKEYWIEGLNKDWGIGCTLVGPMNEDFLRITKTIPRLLLPPDITAQSQGEVRFSAADLEALGRIMSGVVEDNSPAITIAGKIWTGANKVRFVATNNIRFAYRDYPSTYEVFGKLYADFLEASREIGDAVMRLWTDGKVTLENSNYRAVGRYTMLETASPLDFKPGVVERIQYKAIVPRTQFIKELRDLQKLDKHGRVGLQYSNDTIKVVSFEKAKHGWFARAENLLKILTALSEKQVGIGLRVGERQPINVRIPEWTIEVAPVILSTGKSNNTP